MSKTKRNSGYSKKFGMFELRSNKFHLPQGVGLMSMGLLLVGFLFVQGCGYTTKTNLPEHIRSVHVDKVKNMIDISGEVSSEKAFQTYRPGLEVELRNALIERFLFDGHLEIESMDKSDALLTAQLIAFDRDPVRYNRDDSIQEFRIRVKASVQLRDKLSDKVIWKSNSMTGDSEYFLSGELASSEDEAVAEAVNDLVRQIVEHVLEVW